MRVEGEEGGGGSARNELVAWLLHRGSIVAAMATTVAAKPQLSDRLVTFGGRVCGVIRRAPRDNALDNVFKQLARAATSPAANYAEARESVSSRDYVYKMKIVVKELRESLVWLGVAKQAGFKQEQIDELSAECNELIAIAVTCIRRAKGA